MAARKRKKSLTFGELCTGQLREVELSMGVIYFTSPSAKEAMDLAKAQVDSSSDTEDVEKVAKILINCIKDEKGECIFATVDDLMQLPTDVFMELSEVIPKAMWNKGGDAPLGVIQNGG